MAHAISTEPISAPIKAPTMPPQKPMGLQIVKCQIASPIMPQASTDHQRRLPWRRLRGLDGRLGDGAMPSFSATSGAGLTSSSGGDSASGRGGGCWDGRAGGWGAGGLAGHRCRRAPSRRGRCRHLTAASGG